MNKGRKEESSKIPKILHSQRQEHEYCKSLPDGRAKVQANGQEGI